MTCELYGKGERRQWELDVSILSKVDVDQFYGIEIGEFPVRIAETGLWMMDHIMNNRLGLEFGKTYTRIPLRTSPRILRRDALEIDWDEILPSENCSYLFGNPPFVGAKFQTQEQRAQVRRIARLGGSGGTLDYVAAWFIMGGGIFAKVQREWGLSRRVPSLRESRSRSFGRFYSNATNFPSVTPIALLLGALTPEVRRTCMS